MSIKARRLTISRLARDGGVGVETIRYYQRRGLMPVPQTAPGSTYRVYGEEDRRRLRFIRRAQAAGFTLDEIGALIRLDRPGRTPQVREVARARLEALDRQFARVKAARQALKALVSACCAEAAGAPCPILQALKSDDTLGLCGPSPVTSPSSGAGL